MSGGTGCGKSVGEGGVVRECAHLSRELFAACLWSISGLVMAVATTVRVRWDDQAGVEPGWYVDTYGDDGFIDDSQKVWFPVVVDDYGKDDIGGLLLALKGAFPDATIHVA